MAGIRLAASCTRQRGIYITVSVGNSLSNKITCLAYLIRNNRYPTNAELMHTAGDRHPG